MRVFINVAGEFESVSEWVLETDGSNMLGVMR